jgi:hypothetical protein
MLNTEIELNTPPVTINAIAAKRKRDVSFAVMFKKPTISPSITNMIMIAELLAQDDTKPPTTQRISPMINAQKPILLNMRFESFSL